VWTWWGLGGHEAADHGAKLGVDAHGRTVPLPAMFGESIISIGSADLIVGGVARMVSSGSGAADLCGAAPGGGDGGRREALLDGERRGRTADSAAGVVTG
jgi:hypothetical protein